jgi:nucleoside-diphosphate-sugar epimerase
MSRILVTGITSPLGQAVGRKLQAEGHRVVGTLRSSRVSAAGLPADELVALDLENKSSFTNINGGFDAFVHVAAASEGTAEELMTITGLGTLHLVERAKFLSVGRIIHISSMAVYGQINDATVSDKTQINQSIPYGAAKWAAECYLDNESSIVNAVSIRSPAIAGNRTHRHFLAKILNKMSRGEPSISAANPDHMFNNIVHEDKIAEFVNSLLFTKLAQSYQAFPIASTDPIPLRKIVERLAAETKYKGEIKWQPANSSPFSIDSSAAIKLGYKPLTTQDTLDLWMRVVLE